MHRLGVTVLVALLAAGCASANRSTAPTSTAATTGASVLPAPACTSQQEPGIAADFGHFRSVAAANRLIDRASSAGFKGLAVEQRGCSSYAVVLRGLSSVSQGHSLQQEARRVGLRVTIDCRSAPLRGELAAVFGHRRTRGAADRLAAAAERKGFTGLQVVEDRCTDWEVLLYGLKNAADRRAFAREARTAGFHVTFERG